MYDFLQSIRCFVIYFFLPRLSEFVDIFIMHFLLAVAYFLTVVSAGSRTLAPSGCITVGSGGTYSTVRWEITPSQLVPSNSVPIGLLSITDDIFQVQRAVDSLSTSSSSAQCIFIFPGTYSEQVYIAPRSTKLTIYGYTTNTSSYTSNVVSITHSSSLASGAANDDATGKEF